MSQAIFLDRDNTIVVNDWHLGDPLQVVLIEKAAQGIKSMRELGYKIIVLSNQGGVAHGYYNEDAVDAVNAEISRQLALKGAFIDKYYSCFHHHKPKATEAAIREKYFHPNHPWRKPNPGMLLQAAQDFGLNLTDCWMLGDSLKDIEAGIAVGCRTVHVKNLSLPQSPNAEDAQSDAQPHFNVTDLAEAAEVIKLNSLTTFRPPA